MIKANNVVLKYYGDDDREPNTSSDNGEGSGNDQQVYVLI